MHLKCLEVNESATNSSDITDNSNEESLENVQDDAKSTAEESKSGTMQIITNTAEKLASEAEAHRVF